MSAPTRDGLRLTVGLQPVREAIRAHQARVDSVLLAASSGSSDARLAALGRFAKDQGVERVDRRPRADLDRLSGSVAHQGAAAWVPPLELVAPEALLAGDPLLAVALDGIQDPQNFGAVIRSAVGVGDAAVIWPEHASAPLSLATFRASAGAIEHARLCQVSSLPDALRYARDNGVRVVGLDAHADTDLAHSTLGERTVLVVGGEQSGLRRATRRACTQLARLVEPHKIDSLNASVACALALYEARIRRMKSDG